MKKRLLLLDNFILIFLFLCLNIYVSDGTYSADFLNINPQAKYNGLNESAVAIADGVSSLTYNPAGLQKIIKNEIHISHFVWLADYKCEYLAYARKTFLGNWGISFLYFYTSPIPCLDANGRDTGEEVSPYDLLITIGYSRDLGFLKPNFSQKFYSGLSLKFIKSYIYRNYKAISLAIDWGLIYNCSEDFKIGFVLQNIGIPMKYKEDSFPLPIKIRTGIGYNIFKNILLSLESDYGLNDGLIFRAGVEYSYKDCLFARAGYAFEKDNLRNLSFGLGWNSFIKKFNLNYNIDFAFLPNIGTGNSYIASIGIKW